MSETEVVVLGMRGGVASETLVTPEDELAALGQGELPIGPGYHPEPAKCGKLEGDEERQVSGD